MEEPILASSSRGKLWPAGNSASVLKLCLVPRGEIVHLALQTNTYQLEWIVLISDSF